jgi:hypothetical protein
MVEELISNEIKKYQTLKKLQINAKEESELVQSIEQCEENNQTNKSQNATISKQRAEMCMS